MNIARNFVVAVMVTVVTEVLLGLAYPLAVTAVAQLLFPAEANGQLIRREGRVAGSRLIGQQFERPIYFHGRPSAAGDGYDAAASGASNLGPTNRRLVALVGQRVASVSTDNPGVPVPVDLVTASASGLDPDISPAAAFFQLPRVARARDIGEATLRALVESHVQARQLGFLGEPRVNVLELNLALDERWPIK